MNKLLILAIGLLTINLNFAFCHSCEVPIISNTIVGDIPYQPPISWEVPGGVAPAPAPDPAPAPAIVRFNPVVEIIPNLIF